jgi:maleate cis-trans isomerase
MSHPPIRALLVVPANNTTMEPEIRAYCPLIDEVPVARVARPPRTLVPEDIPAYRASTLQATEPFAEKPVDVVIYGCTAAGFLAGPAGDTEIAEALSARFGVDTVTTAGAMVEVLKSENVRNVDVVTPYLDAVNEGLKAYLAASGITVDVLDSFRCATTAELGKIQLEQVRELARATATPHGKALFIACSQLPTRGIIGELRRDLRRPVWSSIQATAWAVLNKLSQPHDRLVA